MGLLILVILIGVPFLEIAVFVKVGNSIGMFNTIFLIVLTTLSGITLLRHQGLSVLIKAQESLKLNKLPIIVVLDGLSILLAGALLTIPGFVTDIIGCLILLPPIRYLLKNLVSQFIKNRIDNILPKKTPYSSEGKDIIDGEFYDVTEDKKPTYEKTKKIDNKEPFQ